jgi:hypothetical protein
MLRRQEPVRSGLLECVGAHAGVGGKEEFHDARLPTYGQRLVVVVEDGSKGPRGLPF